MTTLDRFRLDGRVALITGSGRGLGRAMALAFADAGADVVCSARTQAEIDAVANEVRARGGRAASVQADVTDNASVERMVERSITEFGRIDILVNNAGGRTSGDGRPLHTISEADWLAGIDANLTSTVSCIRAVIPQMLEQGHGKILTTSSGLGLRGNRDLNMYTAAKAGAINLTRSLALSYGRHNIQVNTMAIGLFPQTEEQAARWGGGRYIPVGRFGTTWEIGPVAVFLCSPAADGINGAVIVQDGGGLAGGVTPFGWAPRIPLARGFAMSDQHSHPASAGGTPAPQQPERPFDLRGRVALVTGAARPLGGAIAVALAEAGADVALTGLTGSVDEHFQVNSTANQVWSLGRRNLALQVDLTDPVAVEAAVQRVEDEWRRLDLLVNAQDLLFAMPFGETSLEEWNATLAANLTSVALTCQAAGRVMLRTGYGRIINVASVAGDRGVMNMAAYAAAKSGVFALTRALATEWARTGITVNTVQVGWYEDQAGIGDDPEQRKALTKVLPARTLVTNDEVTGAVVMLAADSGYFTGQVVAVDGAATARI